MRVTLIQPFYHNVWEALGLAYIGAYCKHNYQGVLRMNFFQGYFDDDETIVAGARHSHVVGISATSPAVKHGCNLARMIKEVNPKCHVVMGGWHVTATRIVPEGIDQIVVGEGELAFLDILRGNRDKVVLGAKLPFSKLPWPDRELIKNYRTIDLCEKTIGKRVTSFNANRGCPMNCAYCSESSMTGTFNRKTNPIRSRNIKDVCDELETVIEQYKLDEFKFVDATFDVSAEYVIEFANEKCTRQIDTPWECLVHASFANEKMMAWLKKSNCKQINIGCESGSPKILKDIRKGTTVSKIEEVFDLAKRNNIGRRAFFILGMPNETREDIDMTEALADRLDADVVGFTILCPYPGSDLYDPVKMKYISWDKTDEYSNDFWRSNHLENWELHEKQEHLTKKYKDKLCERQK